MCIRDSNSASFCNTAYCLRVLLASRLLGAMVSAPTGTKASSSLAPVRVSDTKAAAHAPPRSVEPPGRPGASGADPRPARNPRKLRSHSDMAPAAHTERMLGADR
eukprot:11732063-Alexandrium_andersonii.AAC.1